MSEKELCSICNREFRSKPALNSHRGLMHPANGIRKKTGFAKGRTAWNKGLSKETDVRVKSYASTLSQGYDSGTTKVWCEGLTKASDPRVAKMSQNVTSTLLRKSSEGTWHNSFARSRRHDYKGESFDGTWELKMAMWFDSNSIEWVRNKRSFPYIFDRERRYTPDFFLPNVGCYVEVKGWATLKDEAKWRDFPKELQLLILRGEDLLNLGLDIEVKKQK